VPARADLAANVASAKAAGLRYVTGGEPGLSRALRRTSFIYRDSKGRIVRNPRTLARIQALVIPPAWTDVWICAREGGHLQATGRDARRRKQYRYHPGWTAERNDDKYGRMIEFGLALPAIRRRVNADLRKAPLSRDFVLATVVKLLEKTLIRIGNREYARANHSFGLTTMRDEHVRVKGASVRFHFRAKSGVMQTIELSDATLAGIVKKCRKLPGRALFQYVGADGRRQCVDSAEVNAYLSEMTGRPFTAKNFRTWAATVLAAQAFCEFPTPQSEAAFKRSVVQVIDRVARRLGNTRAVCRRCYVHPGVFEAFRGGLTIANVPKSTGPTKRPNFSAAEAAVLALLKRRGHREHGAAAPQAA
jgi:DNA topoisomerase-1